MTLQAYLDNIKAKTGKTPADFLALAGKKGLAKRGELMAWLKAEYGLGHGHANLIAGMIVHAEEPDPPPAESIAALFGGTKARWRGTYDRLVVEVEKSGAGVKTSPTSSYISLLHGGKKFAIVQPTSERLDIGIKLKGVEPKGRLEAAGAWNSMVTHCVRISDPKQVDQQVLDWLREAFEKT
ncbi:MAG: DUF4287 domain-containing protein [Thaumarchaeota archaeon]|nr:DUF4287 domain-containing protein [Nitrososphaerota archaeon]